MRQLRVCRATVPDLGLQSARRLVFLVTATWTTIRLLSLTGFVGIVSRNLLLDNLWVVKEIDDLGSSYELTTLYHIQLMKDFCECKKNLAIKLLESVNFFTCLVTSAQFSSPGFSSSDCLQSQILLQTQMKYLSLLFFCLLLAWISVGLLASYAKFDFKMTELKNRFLDATWW